MASACVSDGAGRNASSAGTHAAPLPPAPYSGLLSVRTEGCGGGTLTGPAELQTTRLDDDSVELVQLSWFSTRVHLPASAVVDVEIREPFALAWIPTMVESTGDGPVDTCLYAALLTLRVDGLPPGDYEWVFRDGSRAADVSLDEDIERVMAARAAEAAAKAAADQSAD